MKCEKFMCFSQPMLYFSIFPKSFVFRQCLLCLDSFFLRRNFPESVFLFIFLNKSCISAHC